MKLTHVLTFGALFLTTTVASRAQSQLPSLQLHEWERKISPPLTVTSSVTESGIRLKISGLNVDAVELLHQLSVLADVQIFVPETIKRNLKRVDIEQVEAKDAIRLICEQAKLSCKTEDGIIVVSENDSVEKSQAAVTNKKKQLISIDFKRAPLRDIFGIIAEFGKVELEIDSSIQGKIGAIRLKDMTAETVLQRIAKLQGLAFSKVGENQFKISAK